MTSAAQASILVEDIALSPDAIENILIGQLKVFGVEFVATGRKSRLTGDTISYVHVLLDLAGGVSVHIVASAIYDLAKHRFNRIALNGRDVSSKKEIEKELSAHERDK